MKDNSLDQYKGRVFYWDNLKALLIFLVVLGHFLMPITDKGRSIDSCYYYIYLFHMPVFVFVSGFFAKRYIEKGEGKPDVTKITGFLLLYIIYKLLIWGVNSFMQKTPGEFELLEESGAPWYLFAMAVWYIILPLFSQFKWYISIIVSVLFSLYAGTVDQIGPFLCLSRIIYFFPFFLLGFYFPKNAIEILRKIKFKFISLVLLCLVGIVIFLNIEDIKIYDGLIYGNRSYTVLPDSISPQNAIFARLLLYCIATLIFLAIMVWIPTKKMCISYIGSRTLSIYIIHKLVKDILTRLNFFDCIPFRGVELLILSTIFCAVLTLVLSNKIFFSCFNSVFNIKYNIFFKAKLDENEVCTNAKANQG